MVNYAFPFPCSRSLSLFSLNIFFLCFRQDKSRKRREKQQKFQVNHQTSICFWFFTCKRKKKTKFIRKIREFPDAVALCIFMDSAFFSESHCEAFVIMTNYFFFHSFLLFVFYLSLSSLPPLPFSYEMLRENSCIKFKYKRKK